MKTKRIPTIGAAAPAWLVALAMIGPLTLASCLKRSDRETVEIPPARAGAPSPSDTLELVPSPPVGAAGVRPTVTTYSLDDAVKYVVQPGDTLGAIATKHGASLRAVKEANKLEDVNKIRAGDTLLLPGPKSSSVEEKTSGAEADDQSGGGGDASPPSAEAVPPKAAPTAPLGGLKIPTPPSGAE